MHGKSLKRKVSKIIRCLSNPLCPNNCQTKKNKGVLHGWLKSNNVIVWMEPFYAQKLLGVEKAKHIIYLCISKTGPFTFENYMRCKSWKCKVSQIIRCLLIFFQNSGQFFFRGFPFTFSTGSTRSLGNKTWNQQKIDSWRREVSEQIGFVSCPWPKKTMRQQTRDVQPRTFVAASAGWVIMRKMHQNENQRSDNIMRRFSQ
jgi:hypothetical protein